MEFHSPIPCPAIPDDLTVAQFMLDVQHPMRPVRTENVPWLIEESTGRSVGFEELRSRTYGLANVMHMRWGIGEDDVVCIFLPNHVDYPVPIWAAHSLGAIVSCANPTHTADELVYQITTTKATVLTAHAGSLPTALAASRKAGLAADHIFLIDELKTRNPIPFPTVSSLVREGLSKPHYFKERKLSPGEGKSKLAFLSFSSGTTGKPKAIALSHYALIANGLQVASLNRVNEYYAPWDKRRFRPGDVALGVLPFYRELVHVISCQLVLMSDISSDIYGLAVILNALLFVGLTVVVVPRFTLEGFLRTVDRFKITHLFLVPPQIVLLCKHPMVKKYDLSHIRYVISGAAPLSKELTLQLVEILPNAEIGQGYGMTEGAISMFPVSQRIGTLGSVGQLQPGTIARVRKADGSFAGYEEEGEIEIRGPQLALRYTNDEKATRETFVDGWLRTGDQVKFAKNGDIFIVDRLKELIKVRGYQVAPAELEGHILDHPDVADVCVVGVPDDYSGEVPFAFVVLQPRATTRAKQDATEAENIKHSIMKHVSDAKIKYKWLSSVEFVDAVAKSPSGKLLRRIMRDKAVTIVRDRGVRSKL
ncbi:hypothetical protein ACEPAF_3866 [Sanghuangporus sanghuang]